MRGMRSLIFALLAVSIAAIVTFPANAAAKPRVSTKYTYYSISGSDANRIYRQMVSRGPHVAGSRALASTTVKTQHGGSMVSGTRCRVNKYTIDMQFTIRLPRLASRKALSPRTRKQWDAFAAFVRRHEERHKAIWIGCAVRTEQRIRKLRARSCTTVDRLSAKVIKEEQVRCNKAHDAFDARDQKNLARHPLVRAARAVPRTRSLGSGIEVRSGGPGDVTVRRRAVKRGRASD